MAPSPYTRRAAVRWVVLRGGKRIAAAHPPSPVAMHSALESVTSRIQSLYLQSLDIPEGYRTDAPSIASLLRLTDRKRQLTVHGINLLVDGFLEFLGFGSLVESLSLALVRDANAGFDAMMDAQAPEGAKPKASIYAINHRASTSEMRHYIDRLRRGNTDLIRKLVTSQVIKTETVLREYEGEHVAVLTERIQKATGTSESHAELLARDQTLKLNADVTQFRARALGANKYTWITSNDERVRGRPGGKWADSQSNHWRLHGKVFEFNNPPVTNEEKGIRLNPGRDYQCRCIAVPDLTHVFE